MSDGTSGSPAAAPALPLDLGGPNGPWYRLTKARYGWFLINRNDFYIGRALDLYGDYCEDELFVLRGLSRSGSLIIEAGANIGAHTVALAQHVGPGGSVIAFEPQRIVFQLLSANIALNGLSNVNVMNRGLGSEQGSMVVPPVNYRSLNNFGGVSLRQGDVGESVEIRALDQLVLPRCDLIKIDVEGMELGVLKGGERTIAKFRPHLYVENNIPDRSPAIISWMQAQGYRMWWHVSRLVGSDNFRGNGGNVFGGSASCNIICVHQTRQAHIAGLREVAGPDDPPPIAPASAAVATAKGYSA